MVDLLHEGKYLWAMLLDIPRELGDEMMLAAANGQRAWIWSANRKTCNTISNWSFEEEHRTYDTQQKKGVAETFPASRQRTLDIF